LQHFSRFVRAFDHFRREFGQRKSSQLDALQLSSLDVLSSQLDVLSSLSSQLDALQLSSCSLTIREAFSL
jgi:hypothetical protein